MEADEEDSSTLRCRLNVRRVRTRTFTHSPHETKEGSGKNSEREGGLSKSAESKEMDGVVSSCNACSNGSGIRSAPRRVSHNIVEKLISREIGGPVPFRTSTGNVNIRPKLKNYHQIKMSSILRPSAFKFDHVFLGLSKCGQFLLSYTYTPEMDVMSFRTLYKYRLHWWSFNPPDQKAQKVAEVGLFGDHGNIYSLLYITLCQWSLDYSRVVICGNSYETILGQQRSYLTITTVPSLNKCQDCLNVAATYENEEDLASIWDSCLRLSCMKHGVTVHTTFDVVSPYPRFQPSICMKRDGYVLLNTGNFLHVLSTSLEYIDNVNSYQKLSCSSSTVENESTENVDQNSTSKLPIHYSHSEGTESVGCGVSTFVLPSKEKGISLCQDVKSESPSGYSQTSNLTLQDCHLLQKESFVSDKLGSSVVISGTRLRNSDKVVDSSNETKYSLSGSAAKKDLFKVDEKNISSNTVGTGDVPASFSYLLSGDLLLATKTVERQMEISLKDNSSGMEHGSKTQSENTRFCDAGSVLNAKVSKVVEDDIDTVSETSDLCCNKVYSIFGKSHSFLHSCKASGESEEILGDTKSSVYGGDKSAVKYSGEFCQNKMCSCSNFSPGECKTRNAVQLSTSEKLVKNFCDKLYSGRVTRSQTLKNRKNSIGYKNESSCRENQQLINCDKDGYIGQSYKENLSEMQCDVDRKIEVEIDATQELSIMSGSPGSEESASVINRVLSPVPRSSLANMESSQTDDNQIAVNRKSKYFLRLKFVPPGAAIRINNPVPVLNSSAHQIRSKVADEAEKAYEFTDEVVDSDSEKFSSYRRRRLADKKYEFCEECEDAENIVPFHLHRRRVSTSGIRSPPLFHPSPPNVNNRRCYYDNISEIDINMGSRSPPNSVTSSHLLNNRKWFYETFSENIDVTGSKSPNTDTNIPQNQCLLDNDKVVLRPLNQNKTASALSLREADNPSGEVLQALSNKKPDSLDGAKDLGEDSGDQQDICYNPARCCIQLKRSYIEVDDELISVITDIEDDDTDESPGYHCALPLEAHGAGYVQLQMISNSKAEKLMKPCLIVLQKSFDIEQFCHYMSARLCEEAGKKFWFCNDYDVEVVDVCPFTGATIILTMMRVLATAAPKPNLKNFRLPQQRKQYKGGVIFSWSVDTGEITIVRTMPLEEINEKTKEKSPWNPAREKALEIKQLIPDIPVIRNVRHCNNSSVLSGKSLERMSDSENCIQLLL